MADYCTVAEVKDLLNANESGSDTLLGVLVTRASALVDAFTRRTFAERTETRYYNPVEDVSWRTLVLDDDLLSVTTLTNGDAVVIEASSYVTKPANFSPVWGIKLLGSSGIAWTYTDDPDDAISVAGSWGYCTAAERPPDITQATARLALWLFRQREAPFSTVGNSYTGEYEVPVDMPGDVQAMLRRYCRPAWGWA